MFLLILLSGESLSQGNPSTFRIQEISVNPNCGGKYCVRANSLCISPIISYSYPSNINNLLPAPPATCYTSFIVPEEILFTNIDSCSNTSFVVPLNGQAVIQSCKCLGPPAANHNFSATIEPDTSGPCDFLIKVFY